MIIVAIGELMFEFPLIAVLGFPPLIVMLKLIGIAKIRQKRGFALLLLEGCKQEFGEEIVQLKKRYAIYLRGFEHEKSSVVQSDFGIGDGVGEEGEALDVTVKASSIELLITQILRKDISLLAFSDPRNFLPIPGAHRFATRPPDWQKFLQELLPDANAIFVYVTSLTEGIRSELDILAAKQWSTKTIVIVGGTLAGIYPSWNEQIFLSRLHKDFKYVVFERNWTRKHEKQFHKNLLARLSTFEADNYEKGITTNLKQKKFQHTTSSVIEKTLKFIIPPIIFLTITGMLFTLIVMWGWYSPWISWKSFWYDASDILYKLPLIIIIYIGCSLFNKLGSGKFLT